MKKLNKTTHKVNILKKRAISMITATALLMASIPMSEISDGIRKLSDTIFSPITASAYQKYNCYDYTTIDDATGYIKIGSWQNLADYSKAYYEASYGTFGEGVSHQNDTILIAIGSDAGNDVDLAGLYEPIGNSLEPFCGKIVFEAGSPNTFNLDCPIFGEVYDSVEIVQSDETTPKQINITRTLDKPGVPLIANKVKSNGGGAEWNVQFTMLSTYSTRVVQYGGAIGEIESGASLNLTFANNAVIGDNKVNLKTNASTDDESGYPVDAGVLCGHLNGSLVATYSGTNYDYSVTSENGNAGGLVGSMGSGGSLTINATAYTDSDYSGVNLQRENALVEAQNGYAGGIVGSNSGGTVTISVTGSPSTYDVKQFITGSSGAGGIYGYYAPPTGTTTFDVTKYEIDCKVASLTSDSGYVGGIVGEMETAEGTDFSFQGSATVTSDNTDYDSKGVVSNAYGGLIGKYKANYTGNTLNINTLTAATNNALETVIYGGAIGKVDSGSFVNANTFTLTSADGNRAGTFGGIAADAEGAYIYAKDVTIGSTLEGGSSSISEFTGGGLVGKLGNGVLGMTGTIDVSKAIPTAADANGQIVGSRDNALIYAENIAANETEAKCDWSYSPNSSNVDNIGSWGDILFIDGTTLSRSNLFASETNHIISLNTVNTSAINSVVSYALASLQFQINPDNNPFLSGYTQLSENVGLSFTDDIVLTNTGLRGITRDNGSRVTYKGNASATSGKKITLDFKNIGGSTDRPVYRHKYLGMLSIAEGSTFTDIQLDGTILDANVRAASNDTTSYVGALTAQAKTSLTVTSCSTADTLNISLENSTNAVTAGRLIGEALNSMGDITITGGTFDGTINGKSVVGGVIGKIGGAKSNANWTFEDVTLKGTVTGVSNVGGLVSEVSGGDTATIKLKGSTGVVADGIKINGKSNDSMGGLLGYNWKNTNVEVTKVSITNTPIITQNSTGGTAGLVYQATGHWEVTSLDLTDIKMAAGSAGSVGMIVNKGTDGSGNGIYLVLPSGYDYKLSFADGSSVDASVSANRFDEICAFSASNGAVMTNGQGIVSISSTGGLVMSTTAADSLTYKPRTTQGKTANPYTRYYYNIDTIDKDNTVTSSAPEKQLMRWGLNQYAANNIKMYFPDPFTTTTDNVTTTSIPAGTYNMSGYSWYPVTPNYTVSVDGTFTFYNKEFEGCETASGSATNGVAWSSLTETQHYMMQNGLFYNVNHNVTIGAVTLKGTIGAVGTGGTGALVYGKVSGSSSATEGITTIDSTSGSISLDGVKVWNFSTASNSYAPLLINKTGSFVNLKISNVSSTSTYGYGDEAGTSLIGYAGSEDSDTYVSVVFTKIKLDARINANSPDLSTHGYPTTKSIFTRATLLERLVGESGTYTYTYNDDWGSGGHNVTYGEEVGYTSSDTTKQYHGEEQWYARSSTSDTKYATSYSTAPTNANVTDTDFYKFLPYVKIVSTSSEISGGTGNYYQLKVNHQPTEVLDGCGTYNDPYIIKTGADLVKISRWISGNDLATATINANFGDTWCDEKAEHSVYNGSASGFTNANDSSDTKSSEEMRRYLAGAYYSIVPLEGTNITIDATSSFTGLGTKVSGYRFRGVIVGNNKSVTNKTYYPLIAYSDGCVVKDLTVVADSSELYSSNSTYIGKIVVRGQQSAYDNYSLPTSGSDINKPNAYGAVIGQIVGGDNIIDNVQLNLTNLKIYLENYSQYAPIGGYVGVIINGGLVFRNMSGTISGLTNNSNITCNNDSNLSVKANLLNSDNYTWLYVNPIIGRVINGYAVTESDEYRPREANVTMKNSTGDHTLVKNYSITDIKSAKKKNSSGVLILSNSEKLDVKSATEIDIPNSQSLYIMSLIVNYGLGIQQGVNKSDLPSGVSLGYYSGYYTLHYGNYDEVGDTTSTDYDTYAIDDINYSSIPSTDYVTKKVKYVPYLVKNYTVPYSATINNASPSTQTVYYGKCISNTNNTYEIELTASSDYVYELSDGFRGIGNITSDSNELRLNVTSFDGNGLTINQNTSYYYYAFNKEFHDAADAYKPAASENSGLGLFNCLNTNGSFENLVLTGNVKCDAISRKKNDTYSTKSGDHIPYRTEIQISTGI